MRSQLRFLVICGLTGLISGCGSKPGGATSSASPEFSLTVSPAMLALTAGGAAQTVTLSATAVNGFTGAIQVTISGLAAGVTASPASFSLASGATQQVSLSAAANTAVGTNSVQFGASSGALSHTASLQVTVTAAPPPPDFNLTVNPATVSLTAGGSAQAVTLSATALNGFTGTVQVTISGLATGVTASPASFSLAPGAPQQVSFSAAAGAAAGSTSIQFSASSGALSHTASLQVTVTAAPPPPDFSLTVSPVTVSLSAGGSARTVTLSATAVNGFTGAIQVTISGLATGVTASPASFSLAPGAPQQVSFSAAAGAAAGSTSVQFSASSGALSHTASLQVTVTAVSLPDFSLAVSPATLSLTAGGSAQAVILSATALNGFTGSVQVTISGLPPGVNANPATLSLAPGAPQQVSFSAAANAAAGTMSVQFGASSGALSHTASLQVTVTAAPPPPDFSLTVSPATLSLTAGGSAQAVTLSATALNGFTGAIQVTISGLATGVTGSPASFSLIAGAQQQVSFSAAAGAAAGTFLVQFTGSSGTLSHSISLQVTLSAASPVGRDVVTYHYDVARTGLNASETALTPANVIASQFGLLRVLAMDGKVDGQPLYLAGVAIGGQQRNVIFGVSEHDSVYAFDADTGAQIWKASVLGANETPSDDHGCSQISPEIGITSTPVIDRQAGPQGTIFVVGMSKDSSGAYHQRLHALDVTTGAEMSGSPVEIRASYPGTGANSSGGNVIFDPGQYAERVGLLLLNGTIYMGWTSHCDQGPYTGWLMGYSETTLAQTSVLNLTPNGSEGSIWMSGTALAADSAGNIFFLDANGTFDTALDANGFPAQHDFGNAFLKVSSSGGNLAVADYFASSNTVAESNADEDLGSGGALVLPDLQDASGNVLHLAVGAGKDGILYVVNRDSMGKFNPQNDSAIHQEINGGGSVFSMPAYFNNTVYHGGVGDPLKAWPISAGRLASSPGAETATTFGYPGTTPAVSANGTTNGIVWAVENSSPAVLHAYDATTLQELYNSSQAANGRDNFGNGNKFITPVIVNGKVLVGTPSGIAEFGLLQ